MIDQKIEGALKAERQRAAQEVLQRQEETLQLKQRLQELETRCDMAQKTASSALSQAEDERRARVRVEAEMQTTCNQAEVAKAKARAAEEGAAATRRELQETKQSLAAATVQQRLLRAYKSEKDRCQADLEETLRRLSAPAWEAEQLMKDLEDSATSAQCCLDSLQSGLASRKRHLHHFSPSRLRVTAKSESDQCLQPSSTPVHAVDNAHGPTARSYSAQGRGRGGKDTPMDAYQLVAALKDPSSSAAFGLLQELYAQHPGPSAHHPHQPAGAAHGVQHAPLPSSASAHRSWEHASRTSRDSQGAQHDDALLPLSQDTFGEVASCGDGLGGKGKDCLEAPRYARPSGIEGRRCDSGDLDGPVPVIASKDQPRGGGGGSSGKGGGTRAPPLPAIPKLPKRQKVGKGDVVHIDITSPPTSPGKT